ncbi:hypothetical protein [Deinococcus radiophilus]|uniref:hypothetical protein n=1 Tax=Deinococcus radiophilus TaxID=32062 RepID=UPI00360D56AD
MLRVNTGTFGGFGFGFLNRLAVTFTFARSCTLGLAFGRACSGTFGRSFGLAAGWGDFGLGLLGAWGLGFHSFISFGRLVSLGSPAF